ncbi:hypothetical protein BN3087_600009 [Sulfurovum sp. enrichment culture clone C5]|uniref:Uncharacterized protein n=1 Tax=Sulfurovum sp. enrichment culture clone C5 TaxID=497650 RepID=A0A0S4XP64_9BACT|nr:hypothetical protein BN3087_600009 [Sulfurovum sp. enrichment culture clone C5]
MCNACKYSKGYRRLARLILLLLTLRNKSVRIRPLILPQYMGVTGFDWSSMDYVHVGLGNSVTRPNANKRKKYKLFSCLRPSCVSLTNFRSALLPSVIIGRFLGIIK